MKKKFYLTFAVISLFALSACDDIQTAEEAAEEAAITYCDCLKNNSKSKCDDQLNSKYKSFVNNDEFYRVFNRVNGCNATISKK